MSSLTPTCCVCDEKFLTNENLYSHVSITHASAPKFSCYACPRSFPGINSWRKHVRKEHPRNTSGNSLPNYFISTTEPENDLFNSGSSAVDADDFHYQYSRFINDFCAKSKCNTESFQHLIRDDATRFAAFVYSLPDVTRKRSFQYLTSITSFLSGKAFSSLENRLINRLRELGETRENM